MMVEMSMMVGVVIALAQVVKQLNVIPVRFIPLVNLCLGIGMCLMFEQNGMRSAIFNGIVVGLTASGLFSAGKNIMHDSTKNKGVVT